MSAPHAARSLRGALSRTPLRSPVWPSWHRGMSSSSIAQQQRADGDDVPEWASDEARTALLGFRQRYAQGTASSGGLVSEYRQALDANQIQLLRITQASMLPLCDGRGETHDEAQLRQREERILTADGRGGVLQRGAPLRSPLVPTEHLAFFTPRVASHTLGADGSDTSFNPPGGIFTRRMWAGGRMTWHDGARPLCVGDEAWERTYVEGAQCKQLAGGRGEMIVVWVRKTFGAGDDDTALLTDRRSWVFQRALAKPPPPPPQQQPNSQATSTPADKANPQAPPGLVLPTLQRQTPANLFRYSALTFNAHAIHLSPPWARDVEGHPNVVVHGPLNLGLLVRKWGRDRAGWRLDDDGNFALDPSGPVLRSVEYRAKRPVYAEQPYWIGFREDGSETDGERRDTVVAMHVDGTVAMEATITSTSTANT